MTTARVTATKGGTMLYQGPADFADSGGRVAARIHSPTTTARAMPFLIVSAFAHIESEAFSMGRHCSGGLSQRPIVYPWSSCYSPAFARGARNRNRAGKG